MRLRTLICLVILFGAVPQVSIATTIHFTWTGTVQSVPLGSGSVAIGDSVSGSLDIDTSALDVDPETFSGVYLGAASAASFELDGRTGSGSSTGNLFITNDEPTGPVYSSDILSIETPVDGFIFGIPNFQYSVYQMIPVLEDSTKTALANDAIPSSLDLGDFDFAEFVLAVHPVGLPTGHDQVVASITTLSYAVVPEPGTGALFALGVAALAARRRVRRFSAR